MNVKLLGIHPIVIIKKKEKKENRCQLAVKENSTFFG